MDTTAALRKKTQTPQKGGQTQRAARTTLSKAKEQGQVFYKTVESKYPTLGRGNVPNCRHVPQVATPPRRVTK